MTAPEWAQPFNVLNTEAVKAQLEKAFFEREVVPLAKVPPFQGSGVVGIMRLSKLVYVGSARTNLWARIQEHKSSVEAARNLNVLDFFCLIMVLDILWIEALEKRLIESQEPIWNRGLRGFGNHILGKTRRAQKVSPWDAAFPGRVRV